MLFLPSLVFSMTACSSYALTKIPITVVSGFLGAGKTTLLQQLLQNSDGLRIAVIVNDMAEVNVDSKLVMRESTSGIVELQNGCACCSKAEELLMSVSELITLNDLRGDDEGFHHILVEMSGVGDPKSVRSKFQEAIFYDMPLLERVQLDTMVTLVDCTPESFLDYLRSSHLVSPTETPELYPRSERSRSEAEGVPLGLQNLLRAHAAETTDSVAKLLVSQVETADVILMTKVDLAKDDPSYGRTVRSLIQALNQGCSIHEISQGNIAYEHVLAAAKGRGVAQAGIVDDHRDAVVAAEARSGDSRIDLHHSTHSHDEVLEVDQPDSSAAHDHTHGHASPQSHHDHSHSHDTTHDHSHGHDCNDPTCTDPSHSHAGIQSFVFRARRPFHPERLHSFLQKLPIQRGISISETAEKGVKFANVIRSKGFSWLANSNNAAQYWSHSGSNFELEPVGGWWATLKRDQWPSSAVDIILEDFDDVDHDDEDVEFNSVGDRRQEIVFIGQSILDNEPEIVSMLEAALLNDEEWKNYVKDRGDEDALLARFRSPFN